MSVIHRHFPGNKLSNGGGFTLLELMVVVSIAAILLGIAIPSFNTTIRNNRLTTYANELVTSFNLARSEAVKRGQEVVVRRTGANWENGWQVFVDIDRTTPAREDVLDAGTDIILRVYPALRVPFTLRGDAANFPVFIRFTPAGGSNAAAAGIFVVCDDSDGLATPAANTSRLIMVNAVGRVSMGVDADNPKDGIPNIPDGTNAPPNSTDCTP